MTGIRNKSLLAIFIFLCFQLPSSLGNKQSEWTFEQAKARWKPLVRPVMHVGIPGYQWQTGVFWDGNLVFGPAWMHRFRNAAFFKEHLVVTEKELESIGMPLMHVSFGFGPKMHFVDRFGTNHPDILRYLDQGRLMIPNIKTLDDKLIWHERIIVHLMNRPPEKGMIPDPNDMLVVRIFFKVFNGDSCEKTANLWTHFADLSQMDFVTYRCDQGKELGNALPIIYEAPFGKLSLEHKENFKVNENIIRYILPFPEKGKILWHNKIDPPTNMTKPAERVIQWQVNLEPKEEAHIELIIPYGFITEKQAQKLIKQDSKKIEEQMRNFWNTLQSGSSKIVTPDSFINDFTAAAVGHMSQQVAWRVRSDLCMMKTAPNQYEVCYPVCTSRANPTFDLRGLTHISRPILNDLIERQTDWFPGTITGSEGYEKKFGFLSDLGGWCSNPLIWGHGMELYAIASHYRITRDDKWLGKGKGSPLQAMLDGCDWIMVQRRRTMKEVIDTGSPVFGTSSQKTSNWGLLPGAKVHDWLAGNAFINDSWSIYGMAEVAKVLREIGHSRAQEIIDEVSDYRKCLAEAYERARDEARPLPLQNNSSIPFVPNQIGVKDWEKVDWTYTSYGPLRGVGALDPKGELIEQTLAFIEAGLPKDLGFRFNDGSYLYGINPQKGDASWLDVVDPNADRHYAQRHYVDYETNWPMFELLLERDDLERFFECFFHNMAITHTDWRSGMESIDGTPGCAPFIADRWRGIRDMFVNERGGYNGEQESLWLLQAIPRSWLKPGYILSAKNMKTYFGGEVSLEVQIDEKDNSMIVNLELSDLAVKPEEIIIRLRSSDVKLLSSVKINGKKTKIFNNDIVKIPSVKKGKFKIYGKFK